MMGQLNLVPMHLKEANEFVAEFHRHSRPTVGGKWATGVSDGEQLWAVCIVGRPVARMADNGFTAEVLRLCTRPDAPKNCCSMLYASAWRAWRAMGGRKMITYTLQSERGTSVVAAGWKCIAEVGIHNKPWGSSQRVRDYHSIYGQAKFRWEVEG